MVSVCSTLMANESQKCNKNEKITTEADKHNILARKKKFLEELEKRIKASNNEQTNETDELMQNIKNASLILNGIANIKVSKNKNDQQKLINKINEFNKKMKKLEESYTNFMQSHKENFKFDNVLDPVSNNFQQETELNWERKVRFDEFKHPLELANIEMSLNKPEEMLEQKQLPDGEISSNICTPSSNEVHAIVHDEQTILKR